jgi:hypothetical protein
MGHIELWHFLVSLGFCMFVKSGLQRMSNSIILFSIGLIAFVVLCKFKGKEITDLQKEAG